MPFKHCYDSLNLHSGVFLSPIRTGSTFLLNSITELEYRLSDNNYLKKGLYPVLLGDKNWDDFACPLGLYRFHYGQESVESRFSSLAFRDFVERLILTSNKVIINDRHDIFKITLSWFYRHRDRELEIAPKQFSKQYSLFLSSITEWRLWINSVIPKEKRIDISYEELSEDVEKLIDRLSNFLNMELTYTGELWKIHDYSYVTNLSELLSIIELTSLE